MTTRPHILPSNASTLERTADQAMPEWGPLVDAFKPPSEGEPPSFLPWYAAEWGLADFADHFPDAEALIRAGVPWLLERGTAAAVLRALAWMGLDHATLDEDDAYLHIDIGRPATDAELMAVARLVRPSIPAHVRFYRVFHGWDLRHARADASRWDSALWDNCSGVWVDVGTGQPIKASFGHTRTALDPLPNLQPAGDDGRTHIHTDLAKRADTYAWDSWRWDDPVILLDVYEGVAAIDTRSTTAPPALPAIGYAPGHHGAYSGDATPTAAAQQPLRTDTATQDAVTASPWPSRGWTGPWDATPWRPAFPSQEPTLMQQAMAALRRNGGSIWMPYESQLGFGSPNLLSAPEFKGGLADAPISGGLLSVASLAGYDNAIAFGHDGATSSYALKTYAHTAGLTYTVSVLVAMDDGMAPTFGAGSPTGGTCSLAVVGNGQLAASGSAYVVTQLAADIYSVSWTYVAAGAVGNCGVYKYATNNARTFRVTGYKLEVGGLTAYTPQAVLATLGGYVDSSGTQSVSAVGDVMGLLLEKSSLAAGTERVVNGNFADGATGWSVGAGWAISVGAATATNTTAALRNHGASGFLTVGKWHKVTITVSVHTAGTLYFPYDGTGLVAVPAKPGTYTSYFLCDYADYTYVYGSAFSGVITKVSVIELAVSHAVQATTANKPTVTRIPKKLGPNMVASGDGSSLAPWAGSSGYSLVAGALKADGATVAPLLVQNIGVQKEKTYQVTFKQSGRTAGNCYLVLGGTQPAGTPNLIASQTYSFTITPTTTAGTIQFATPSGTFDGSFDDIAVREVLEWQPALSFDGSNDSLQTAITTGNEGWMCAGVTMSTLGDDYRALFYAGAVDVLQKSVYLIKGKNSFSDGKIALAISNGTTRYVLTSTVPLTPGSPFVADAGWSTSTRFVSVDGHETSEASTGNFGPSAGVLQIGSYFNTNTLNGQATAFIYCPTLPSAADRALIRRYVGSLQGQAL